MNKILAETATVEFNSDLKPFIQGILTKAKTR